MGVQYITEFLFLLNQKILFIPQHYFEKSNFVFCNIKR